MAPSKRILVTGGNGYVGRCVTRLLSQDHTVCVADALRYGDWRFTVAESSRLRLEKVDIRDADGMRRLMDGFVPDVVVHLAAIHYIPECDQDPLLAVSTNVLGTLNLLLTCPEGCRFVFASSGAVYKPAEQPHCEATSELGPSDVYGRSKLQGEQFVQDFAAKRGLAAVIVRLFNVIGPGETNPHLLPELVAQLKAGRDTVELGNLSPKRDYISVQDAARGFAAAAVSGATDCGEARVVNLGTSRAYSVAEIVGKLRSISGINFVVRQDESRVRRVDRPFLAADVRCIAELFGWRPAHTIDDALRELWREPDLSNGLVARYQ
jgi:UDP-glucose 4-epimerase